MPFKVVTRFIEGLLALETFPGDLFLVVFTSLRLVNAKLLLTLPAKLVRY